MYLVKVSEQVAQKLVEYGYGERDENEELNASEEIHINSVLALMDFAVCLHEIAGGKPYWFTEGTCTDSIHALRKCQVLDLTMFVLGA